MERVLEKSGLERPIERCWHAFTTADGNRVFPDVVINLPMEKIVKLFFELRMKNTSMKRTIEVKVGFKEHVNSIKRHAEQLGANKNYPGFIPN
jgi:DNA recombination protein RmuC